MIQAKDLKNVFVAVCCSHLQNLECSPGSFSAPPLAVLLVKSQVASSGPNSALASACGTGSSADSLNLEGSSCLEHNMASKELYCSGGARLSTAGPDDGGKARLRADDPSSADRSQ